MRFQVEYCEVFSNISEKKRNGFELKVQREQKKKKAADRLVKLMKPLQHAQISAKSYGGCWQDYSVIHSFLDSSKAACAHFKHRFLLHHREGVELGVRIFGEP